MHQRIIRRLWVIVSVLVIVSMIAWTIGVGFAF